MKKNQRNQTKKNIVESENVIRPLYERAPVPYQSLDIEGKIIEVNNAWLEQFGYQLQEVIGHSLTEFLTPQYCKIFPSLLPELIRAGETHSIEYDLTKRNGDIITVSVEGTVSYDKDGTFQQTHCVLHNITERKRSETLNRVLLEIMQGVVITKDLNALLALIHKSISNVILAENFFVVLYNKKTGLFEEVYTVDKYDSPAPPSKLEKSVSSYVFRTRQPILCTDAIFEELIAKGEVELVGHNSPSWLGVPLNTSTETIGVMVVQDYEISNRYSERDIELLVSIAGQVALVVERLKAEEALIQSENLLRETQSIAGLGSYILDIKTGIWDSSDILDSIFGIDDHYHRSIEGWAKIIYQDDRKQMTEYFLQEVLGKGKPFDREYRIQRICDNEIRWVHGLGKLEANENHEFIKMMGIIQDITERKRAEEALRESEMQYSHLIETMEDGVYRSSHEGKFLEVNPAMVKILGYESKEELMAIDIKSQLYFDVQDRESAALDEKLQEMAIFRLKRKDGSEVWVEDHGRHVVDDDGNVLYHEGVLRDITERMRAEQALRASEAELRSLFAAMNDVVLILDKEGRYLKIAPTNPSLLFKPSDELLGRKVHDVFPKHHADFFVEHIRHCLETKTVANVDYTIQIGEKDIYFYATVSPLTEDSVIWVGRDITERILVVNALRENEEQYRNVVTVSPDAIVIHCEGKIVYANPAAVTLVGGKSPEDILGKSPLDFVHPEEREFIRNRIFKIAKGEMPSSWLEERFVKLDGSVINVEVISVQTPYQGKSATQVVVRDITERKRTEKEINTLAHALRSISECVSITDMENNLLFVNEAFLHTYGYEEHDLIGNTIDIVNSPNNPPKVAQEIRTMTHKGGWRGEILNTKKDGTEFPIFLSTSIIRDDKEVPIALIGVATDITEIKNAEEKRKSLEVQLQQSQKLESLGTLASGIAHDFNNILGIIIGHAVLLGSLPPDRTIIKKNSDAITKASKRGAALVKQLLTFARKTDILVESIRLNDIVIEVSKLLGETFPKTITIILNLEDKLPSIIADATQIHQVILNLCVNARDAMPEGGALSITTFKVSGDLIQAKFPKVEAKEYVALFVDDTGVGMDDETRRRIFEPFFTTKDIGKGTGLGLSMVFGIVESHNGFIDVHSELGKGTTFEIYFPLPYKFIEADEPIEELTDTNLMGNETILIIEDEELLRDLLKGNLESYGYRILTAEDGEDGVLQYSQHQQEIQLVISDLGLPKLSGFEAFKKMKLLNPDIHFMIASGFIDPDEKTKMLAAGIENISPKPYSTEYLLRIARKILDSI